MKISFAATTLNEEKSVHVFLDSVLNQSLLPNEVVIVDGGSRDRTKEILKSYETKFADADIEFGLVSLKKASIAKGRNEAVKHSRYEIIAMSDAGCILNKNWLKKIVKPFEKNMDIVAGFYNMPQDNPLSKVAGIFLGVTEKKFDQKNFLPSTRSVAFTKNIWKKLGGFNEKLEGAGEDSEFFALASEKGVKIMRVKSARVEWKELSDITLGKFCKKVFSYAKGDVKSGIWWHPTKKLMSHNIKVLTIFLRYIILCLLLSLTFTGTFPSYYFGFAVFAYLLFVLNKTRRELDKTTEYFLVFPLQIISDFCVMSGFLSGVKSKLWKS